MLFGTNLVNNISTKAPEKAPHSFPNLHFFGAIKVKCTVFSGFKKKIFNGIYVFRERVVKVVEDLAKNETLYDISNKIRKVIFDI